MCFWLIKERYKVLVTKTCLVDHFQKVRYPAQPLLFSDFSFPSSTRYLLISFSIALISSFSLIKISFSCLLSCKSWSFFYSFFWSSTSIPMHFMAKLLLAFSTSCLYFLSLISASLSKAIFFLISITSCF